MQSIIQAARSARRWAMRTRHKHYVPGNLCGMCAIASHRLSQTLTSLGIVHRIAITDGHVWVEVGKYAVDVTATQFGYPPIHICDSKQYKRDLCRKYKTRVRKYAKTGEELRVYLGKYNWIPKQIPKK